ncbi:hypothetical protein ANN_05670 [Periplaneta americana]|uniref:Histone-lysine N-methyltransferase SETMAR n=1 Tax=Periplaneta americana TaxID=6978 RepID=A0ABQ8TD92_PERAM|nr:hypothetical protein ANN_05670 [Periplaneta americana]
MSTIKKCFVYVLLFLISGGGHRQYRSQKLIHHGYKEEMVGDNHKQPIPNLTGSVDNNDVTLQRNRNKTAGRIDGCHGDCLCQVYGPNIMSKQMVRRWCRQFSEGRQSVHDEERSGRPSLINDDRVELVRQCIMENHRFTITELSSHFPQISRSLLHEIVTKHLFKKVCARTKFKQTLSVRKVMCTVFWDRKGILLIDFLPRGETVNADRYYETLRKLRRAIQNKRRGMLTAGVVRLHDNARPHTARRTAAVLTEFGWELFDHPPYSPDLTPSDFHVFLHFKKFLSSGERFGNDKELKTSVTRWFHSQAAEFYDRGIQKLIPRYDKCLNSDGGYVEK